MQSLRRIAVPFVCLVVVCGAIALARAYKRHVRLAVEARETRASAERGDVRAETKLGSMYYHGQGVPRDYAEATRWFRKAAEQGETRGEYDLGGMYDMGKGVAQSDAEALRWYRKAVEQGDPNAEVSLGSMIYDGRGVTQDAAVAAGLYRKAADQGLAAAEDDLGYLYYYGQGVPEDRAESERWYRKAADAGDVRAQRALGLRGAGPGGFNQKMLAVQLLGCLFLLRAAWQSRHLGERWRLTASAGLLGLVYMGLDLYGLYHFGRLQAGFWIDTFIFANHGLSGVFLILLVSVVYSLEQPGRAKIGLAFVGVCFAAFTVYAMTHLGLRNHVPAVRLFCMVSGLSTGMAIALGVLLLRARDSERGGRVTAVDDAESSL